MPKSIAVRGRHWKTSLCYFFVDNEWCYVIANMSGEDLEDGDGESYALVTMYNKAGDTEVSVLPPDAFKELIDDLKEDKIMEYIDE